MTAAEPHASAHCTPTDSPYVDAMSAVRLPDCAKNELERLLAAAAAQPREGCAERATAPEPNVIQTATSPVRPRRCPSKRLAAGIALAAALALGMGGLAVAASINGKTGPLDMVAQLFRAAPANEGIVDQMGTSTSVGQSQTSDGLTITLDSVVGDETTAILTFSLEPDPDSENYEALAKALRENAPEAFYLDSADHPLGNRVILKDDEQESHSAGVSSKFFDVDPADLTIQYALTIFLESEPLLGKTAHVTFARFGLIDLHPVLEAHGIDANDPENLVGLDPSYYVEASELGLRASGPWEFEVPLDHGNTTRELPTGQTLVFSDSMTATVERLSVSPIRLEMTCAIVCRPYLDADRAFLTMPVALTMDSGEVVEVTANKVGSIHASDVPGTEDERHYEGTFSATFDRVVNLDEVASIAVGGLVVPVG